MEHESTGELLWSRIPCAERVRRSTCPFCRGHLPVTETKNGVYDHASLHFHPRAHSEANMSMSAAPSSRLTMPGEATVPLSTMPSRVHPEAGPVGLKTPSPTSEAQAPYVTVTPESNVEQWTRAISVAIVDVVSGRRRSRSIERWLSPKAFSVLSRGVARRDLTGGALPSWAISSRVFPQGKGHYEFTATVWDQNRARAVAGHIAAFRGRWLVTELEL